MAKIKNASNNCLLIYGGGLCDSANFFMREFMRQVTQTGLFQKIYVGFFSFEALLNPTFIEEWSKELEVEAAKNYGGYFGTCRGVNLTEPKLLSTAIKNLKKRGITWLFVGGGDGSSRQVAEIAQDFENEGIKVSFVMPCTLDGIEGGESIGLWPAVNVSVDIIEKLASTSLRTRDSGKFPILIIELQGRNRDDILANVLCKLSFNKINCRNEADIYAIPANYAWDENKLISEVNSSKKPVLILLSEGASIEKDALISKFNRKTRFFSVAHLSQINGYTDKEEKTRIERMLQKAFEKMSRLITQNESFCFVYKNNSVGVEPIDYYAKLNPRSKQIPTLDEKLEQVIKEWTPTTSS